MSHNRARHLPDGSVLLDRMDGWLLEILQEMPGLLGRDQPDAVRRRLYPDPVEDPDDEVREEWDRNVVPELFALLAGSKEIVERDLGGVKRLPGGAGHRLVIPAGHRAAWIAALNAARLALGAMHGVDARDMDSFLGVVWDERTEAIGRIHVLGWLQVVLVEGVDPESVQDENPPQ